MSYLVALALAVGFGLPIAVLSAAISQSKVGVAAMEGIARQPEATSKIQLNMLIALAFIESLVIYSLLIFFLLQGKLPDTKAILDIVQKATGG